MGKLLREHRGEELVKIIRSQKLVRPLQLHVAYEVSHQLGIEPENILLEVELPVKNVDILIVDNTSGKDMPLLSISIRTQVASIKKNFTNNVNQLQGEVVSLKNYYPSLFTALVYLFSKVDMTTGEDCTSYYSENIPHKLLPTIGYGGNNRDRFDAALILVREWNDEGEPVSPSDLRLDFLRSYSPDAFWAKLSSLVGETRIKARYRLSLLMQRNEQEKFLGN